MSPKKFTRRVEDFTCGHCGAAVTGNGYTNHCPRCLWSCHVDVNPGDRAAGCGGLMRPVGVAQKDGAYMIEHVCEKCGEKRRCRSVPPDSVEALIAVSKGAQDRYTKGK